MAEKSDWLVGLLDTFDSAKSQATAQTNEYVNQVQAIVTRYDLDTGETHINTRQAVGDFSTIATKTSEFFKAVSGQLFPVQPSEQPEYSDTGGNPLGVQKKNLLWVAAILGLIWWRSAS